MSCQFDRQMTNTHSIKTDVHEFKNHTTLNIHRNEHNLDNLSAIQCYHSV